MITSRSGSACDHFCKLITLALPILIVLHIEPDLKGKGMELEFVVTPVHALPPDTIRFAGKNIVVMSRSAATRGIELSWMPIGFWKKQPRARTWEGFTGNRDWDAVAIGTRQIRVVSYEPGSGIAPLVTFDSNTKAGVTVDHHDSRGIMMFPHFVRHAKSGPAISAVDLAADYAITYYPASSDGAYGQRKLLPVPAAGVLLDARMVALGTGYLLVIHRFRPGPYRVIEDAGQKKVQRSGVLELLRLNDEFQPVAKTWKPFGDNPFYNFDIDVRDDTIALFGTDTKGWKLSLFSQPNQHPYLQFSGSDDTLLSSPAILFSDLGLTMAMLRNDGPERKTVLMAELPLP